jgi:hypothetical protein
VPPKSPADPEALSAIARGLLIHNYTADVHGLRFSAERMSHKETVGADAIRDNVIGIDPVVVVLRSRPLTATGNYLDHRGVAVATDTGPCRQCQRLQITHGYQSSTRKENWS